MSELITSDVSVAVEKLLSSHLCAIPTETVYGLAASAHDDVAIRRVFEAKGRPVNHPLIVHVADLQVALKWISALPDWAITLASKYWPGPLTLVGERTSLATDLITGGQNTVAVRVPAHPQVQQLLQELNSHGVQGIVAPSANRFGHVSPTTCSHVSADLGAYLKAHDDAILDGGACNVGIESTIVSTTTDVPVILRPGYITNSEIEAVTGRKPTNVNTSNIRISGNLSSHYSPQANVFIVNEGQSEEFRSDSGFLALRDVPTPSGVMRLDSPQTTEDFATCLYSALRRADELNLKNIYVVIPQSDELSVALLDRISRAAYRNDETIDL